MNRASESSAYDAFGDLVVDGRQWDRTTRRARLMAIAVFWSVALLLIAGRVYQSEIAASVQPGVELASR